MKREQLTELGLDKEQVDQVEKLFHQQEGKYKEKLEAQKALTEKAQGELAETKNALEEIKQKAKDNEDLQKIADQRLEQISELEDAIKTIKLDSVVNKALTEAGAKDLDLVKRLIKMEMIEEKDGTYTGIEEQITELLEGETSALLFNGEVEEAPPVYQPAASTPVTNFSQQKAEPKPNPFFTRE